MSLEAMSWARKALPVLPDDVKAPARLALLLLADYAGIDHVSWPSIRTMAGEMGCAERSVQRAIDVLEARGLLTVEARHDTNGRQRSNAYRLSVGGGCQFVTPTSQTGEGANLTPPEGDNLTPRGDTGVRGRVSPVSPLEPTTRTENNSPSGASGSEHSIFQNANRFDDQAQPMNTGARQFAMSLDWVPDTETLRVEFTRRGMPADTAYTPAELADFTAHYADQPRQYGTGAWTAKFARWIHENRKREAARKPSANSTKTGARHATGSKRTPIGDLDPAQARQLFEQQQCEQQFGGGSVYDGECEPGHG